MVRGTLGRRESRHQPRNPEISPGLKCRRSILIWVKQGRRFSFYRTGSNFGVGIMAAPAISERHITHICEMMQRLGIEPGGGVIPHLALSYATAFRRCKICGTREACRKWLDCRSASNGLAPRFCPNADIFLELRLEAPTSDREGAHGLGGYSGQASGYQ